MRLDGAISGESYDECTYEIHNKHEAKIWRDKMVKETKGTAFESVNIAGILNIALPWIHWRLRAGPGAGRDVPQERDRGPGGPEGRLRQGRVQVLLHLDLRDAAGETGGGRAGAGWPRRSSKGHIGVIFGDPDRH